ncbi:MAG TPA: carbohydrate kinase family protein [Chloroflexota bacterium]|nr:carbohydrate kinase family protein [Chloroflexota bacterium]
MILLAGDIMLDILLLPELRAAEQATGILLRGGGSAANTATWVCELGAEATLAGCVGNDGIGSMLIRELEDSGVRTCVRRVAGAETGCVVVELSPEGERVMRSARGANQALAPEDITAAAAETQPDAVHVTGYALLGPHGLTLLDAAADIARGARAYLSFDPSSVGVIRRHGTDRLLATLADRGVTVLLPNADEALALAGCKSIDEAARTLSRAIPAVIVKDGSRGAVVAQQGEVATVMVTARPALDSTGAGDAFDAGVLVGLCRGESLQAACRLANHAAARAIAAHGGHPPRAESSGSPDHAGST